MFDKLKGFFSKLRRQQHDAARDTVTEGVLVPLDGRTAVALTEAWVVEAAALGSDFNDAGAAGIWRREMEHGLANFMGSTPLTVETPGSRQALAAAVGLALTGARSTAFLMGPDLAQSRDILAQAVSQRLPLVVHAGLARGHDAYYALADTGAMLFFASNVQEAVDLALVARRASEQALVPALVAMDAQATLLSMQDVRLPDPSVLKAYLGTPEEWFPSPNTAQRLLFGDRRRRIPRRFDLESRLLLAPFMDSRTAGLAEAGGRAYFQSAVPGLVEEALSELTAKVGREQGELFVQGLEKSEVLLIAQGAAVETAAALGRKLDIGVVGVRSLRPFPGARLVELLKDKKVAAVLDCVTAPAQAEPPLLREVRGALAQAVENDRFGNRIGYPALAPGRVPRLCSVSYGLGGAPLRSADLAELCRRLANGAPDEVLLGLDFWRDSTYPRRQALMDQLRRAYPGLQDVALRSADPAPKLTPEGAISVGVLRRSGGPGVGLTERLGVTLFRARGGSVRSRREATHEVWGELSVSRVVVASDPVLDPGDDAPLDLLVATEDVVAERPELGAFTNAACTILVCGEGRLHGGARSQVAQVWRAPVAHGEDGEERLLGDVLGVLLGTDRLDLPRRKLVEAREEDWEGLPKERRAELRAAFEAGLDQAEQVDPSSLPAAREFSDRVPETVRRLSEKGDTLESLARFWSQVGLLYRRGETAELTADPYVAGNALPPLTSACRDLYGLQPMLPRFEPELCTGCGRCWVECPESAVGPLALSPGALLEAGMAMAAEAGKPADALRRVAGKMPAAMGKLLKSDSPPGAAQTLIGEAYEEIKGKLKLDAGKLQALDLALEAVTEQLGTLPLAHPEPISGAGGGELLSVVFNPETCKGCGVCVAACEPQAIKSGPADASRLAQAQTHWSLWEQLPESSTATIERLWNEPEVGPAAALSLGRRSLLAMAGGDGAEPASGRRLALRLVLGAAEHHLEPIRREQLKQLGALRTRLAEAIRSGLADGLPTQDLDALGEGLTALGEGRLKLSELSSQLESAVNDGRVDSVGVHRLVNAGRNLADLEFRLRKGDHGLGRAHLGLAVAPGQVAWAGAFPLNPFLDPVVMDRTGDTLPLALGLLEGQLKDAIDGLAALRGARAELEGTRTRRQSLTYADLTDEERSLCPPLLVVGTERSLSGSGLDWLLSQPLPVKVLVLADPGARLAASAASGSVDTGFLALMSRSALVVQSSSAAADHLVAGVLEAFAFSGPALIRVHAPSPRDDGFPTEDLLAQARRAVESRVFPLWTYDPRKPGVFGTRLDLSENPSPDEALADAEPAEWALGQERFAGLEGSDRLATWSRECQEAWRTLQELAGVVTPFVEVVRTRAEEGLAGEHQRELEMLHLEYAGKMAEIRAEVEAEMSARVQERLRNLVAFAD